MIKVGVVGAAGRMGREVISAVEDAPDLHLVALIDPNAGDVALDREVVGMVVKSIATSPYALLNAHGRQGVQPDELTDPLDCGVRGLVVDHDDQVDKIRHSAQHLDDLVLLVEAGNDDCDGFILQHKNHNTPTFVWPS